MYKENKHLHPHPRDALRCIQCPNVDGFEIPKMECILRRYTDCPEYEGIIFENNLTEYDNKIRFQFFHNVCKYSIHGKLAYDVESFSDCDLEPDIESRGKVSQKK